MASILLGYGFEQFDLNSTCEVVKIGFFILGVVATALIINNLED